MNNKWLQIGVVGIGILVLFSSIAIDQSTSEGAQDPSTPGLSAEKKFSDQLDQHNTPRTAPVLPPTNDPEMVVKPRVPTDPDAVVTPPVVDPEMAVDPASGERLTPEKLEQLTPEELQKQIPDRKK